jgi:hypothetical protein
MKPGDERRVGRPRIADSKAVRDVRRALAQEGVKQQPLAQFVHEITPRLNVSRARAYGLIVQADQEGKIRIQGF